MRMCARDRARARARARNPTSQREQPHRPSGGEGGGTGPSNIPNVRAGSGSSPSSSGTPSPRPEEHDGTTLSTLDRQIEKCRANLKHYQDRVARLNAIVGATEEQISYAQKIVRAAQILVERRENEKREFLARRPWLR
jgi:hypothetical protein